MNGMNTGGMQPQMMQPMQAPAAALKVTGFSVPMVMNTPAGEVTVQVNFAEENANNIPAALAMLVQQGWPVKAYQPKPQFGGGGFNNGGGFNGGGGGGYNGGGYRRGGRY